MVPLLRIKGVVTLLPRTRTLRRPAIKPHLSLLFVMSETQNPEMQRPKTPVTVGGTSSRQEPALAAAVASKWFLTWLLLLRLWRFKLSILFTHSVRHTGCVVASQYSFYMPSLRFFVLLVQFCYFRRFASGLISC